jgi:hypothetical protein
MISEALGITSRNPSGLPMKKPSAACCERNYETLHSGLTIESRLYTSGGQLTRAEVLRESVLHNRALSANSADGSPGKSRKDRAEGGVRRN